MNTKYYLFIFCLLLSLVLRAHDSEQLFPIPRISVGVAKVSGHIVFPPSASFGRESKVTIGHMNLITEKIEQVECNVAVDGDFSMDVPIERDNSFVYMNVQSGKYDYGWQVIGLNQKRELAVDVKLIDSTSIRIYTTGGVGLINNEFLNTETIYGNFEEFRMKDEDFSTMSPEEFLKNTLNTELKMRIQASIDTFTFSARIQQFLVNDLSLRYMKGRVFHYKTIVDGAAEYLGYSPYYFPYSAVEPDVSFYSFLKTLNLNNPQYLYGSYYSDFLRSFLSIPVFKIPVIGDVNVEEWLKGVKATTKSVLGFDSGLFYDLLVAKAYAIQLIDKKKPFSEPQKENMTKYFERNNPELLKILIQANDELTDGLVKNLRVCELPNVPNEVLLDSIVGRYKGSVTIVDLWETWCGPCLNAHENMRLIKPELKDKGVKFVYIADESSPLVLWNAKIRTIGGDQYYFSKNQWDYLLSSVSVESIPAYLIYNKSGKLIQKFVGFPGVDKMKELLLDQLNK